LVYEPLPNAIGHGLLGREVERVLAAHGWSLQAAEVATGIPASTINRMRKGLAVKLPTILRFGEAVGEHLTYWGMVAVGMPPSQIMLEPAAGEVAVYERDPRTFLQAPEGYRDLDEVGREFVKETLQVAVEAALRRQRQAGPPRQTPGHRAGGRGGKKQD
jgi:hypothetical protein